MIITSGQLIESRTFSDAFTFHIITTTRVGYLRFGPSHSGMRAALVFARSMCGVGSRQIRSIHPQRYLGLGCGCGHLPQCF